MARSARMRRGVKAAEAQADASSRAREEPLPNPPPSDMKLIAKLLHLLNSRARRPPYVPSARRYKPVDVERLRHELRLDARARQNGRRNFPPTESVSLDSVEQQIVEKLEAERKTQLDDFLQH